MQHRQAEGPPLSHPRERIHYGLSSRLEMTQPFQGDPTVRLIPAPRW